jgi:mono/diheme cytochrome c family protein
MMPAPMLRPLKLTLLALVAVALTVAVSACGTEKLSVAKSDPTHNGAVLFNQRCGGCHTLSYAATHGSASNIRTRERNDGPNFNIRKECIERVLYAIENGGFSGAIMPQNIVVGAQANEVAAFVAKYAGRKAPATITPGAATPQPDAANGYHCTKLG